MKNSPHSRVILSFILVLMVSTSDVCFGQTIGQGPENPSAVTEQNPACLSCLGSDWLNMINAVAPDGVYTKTTMQPYRNCFQASCYFSRSLMASNFGFTIPLSAVITGIKVEVLRKASSLNAVQDSVVQLLLSGSSLGTNRAAVGYWDTTAASYFTYGDSTDLWGISWTPSGVNATTFGLFFKTKNLGNSVVSAYIDHIRVTVYYQVSTGLIEHQVSDNQFNAYYNADEQAITTRIVQMNFHHAELKIFNATGQLVFEKQLNDDGSGVMIEKIRVENLNEGIYFVEFISDEKSFSKKIIIRGK